MMDAVFDVETAEWRDRDAFAEGITEILEMFADKEFGGIASAAKVDAFLKVFVDLMENIFVEVRDIVLD